MVGQMPPVAPLVLALLVRLLDQSGLLCTPAAMALAGYLPATVVAVVAVLVQLALEATQVHRRLVPEQH
jgi:hypothetical protein